MKEIKMKILLVYPKYPDTFWSFRYALKFVWKKAAFPPLGLLTVAAMLPKEWEKKLIDMNVSPLVDKDIKWADYVFISAMAVQENSVMEIINRVKAQGKKIIAGGPLFTADHERFNQVDHLVLNEAELTLPVFLKDLSLGRAESVYSSEEHPEITATPLPLWELISLRDYACMSVQYSRGCPFDCEFCDITFLDGHTPRTKTKEQIIDELDLLYNLGWRGSLFIVDDNFIGNIKKLKAEILPTIIEWQKKKKYPFSFFTEASINLTKDEELMRLMRQTGFNRIFVGIETPNQASLIEAGKKQNIVLDLADAVKIMQKNGFEVMGGFIIGFDNDPDTIFDDQISFIQKSGIVTAMVGILNVLKGTRLYQRLKKENRLLEYESSGNNVASCLNFVPKMNKEKLVAGYKYILQTIYGTKQYYKRIETFLLEYKPMTKSHFSWYQLVGLINCIWIVGLRNPGRRDFWKVFFTTLAKRPKSLPTFFMLSIYGHHFRKVVKKIV